MKTASAAAVVNASAVVAAEPTSTTEGDEIATKYSIVYKPKRMLRREERRLGWAGWRSQWLAGGSQPSF